MGKRRIVLVTDQNVYLFQGPRFDRPKTQLGKISVGPDVLPYDGAKLTFPDGQIVYLTQYQADVLADASGQDVYSGIAEELATKIGISGESPVTAAWGTDPA